MIDELLSKSKFWLDMGIDGFRVDATNFFVYDEKLRDNPMRSSKDRVPDGIDSDHPMAKQLFEYSFCRDETIGKLERIRNLLDIYEDKVDLLK